MKKAVVVLLVLFVGFWMFTDPHGLARSAHTAAVHGAAAAGDFFRALILFMRAL